MCSLFASYSIDGDETLLDSVVTSYDPRTVRCFKILDDSVHSQGYNYDAKSTYEGPIDDKLCLS